MMTSIDHWNRMEDAFSEGITLIFSGWPVLKVAIEEQWGGHESSQKLQWLIEEITYLFLKDASRSYSSDDIEAILEDVLRAEFNVEVDDGSISHVSGCPYIDHVRNNLAINLIFC
jgi:pre-rRNA-processing protein TSR2